jgi:hypothetical protein
MQKGPAFSKCKKELVLLSKCKRSSTAELAIKVPVMLSGASRIIMDGHKCSPNAKCVRGLESSKVPGMLSASSRLIMDGQKHTARTDRLLLVS